MKQWRWRDGQEKNMEIITVATTQHGNSTGSFSGSGAEPNLGPDAGRDSEPFMLDGDEEVTWPSEEEIEDKEDSEGPPTAG
ncbi:hypothetical protein LWI29_002562 [Acer saccharum]|uniref:Uncharacterized protein n=1 Tax=Acer saccharum TaxID=4024 RepID=A0AA39RU99_ACESA|nr:hypothetical protein LWI29_002562 [Acer saccharum]